MSDPEKPLSEKDRNDREAGRQLAVLALLFGVGGGGFMVWAAWGTDFFVRAVLMFAVVPLVIGALGLSYPMHAIRLVMGRWAELFPDSTPSSTPATGSERSDDDESVLAKVQEGLPADAALTEALIKTKRGRARLGIALMVLGVAGGIGFWAAESAGLAPSWLATHVSRLCFGASFVGLVVWYRTL